MNYRTVIVFFVTILPVFCFLIVGYYGQWLDGWVVLSVLGCVIAGIFLGFYPAFNFAQKAHEKLTGVVKEHHSKIVALEEKALETNLILNSIPDPLFLLSGNKKVLLANGASEYLTQKPIEGLFINRVFADNEIEKNIDEALKSGKTKRLDFKMDLPIERNYQVRIVPINSSILFRFVPDSPAVLMAFQEVTAVMRTKKIQSDFLANVSHELRTPLTSLIGFTETLRNTAKDDFEVRDKFLDIMQDQADRMYRLVADLLSLSKIEMNEHSIPDTPVKLDDVITKVCDMFVLKAQQHKINFVCDFPAHFPEVKGDEDQLTQVFQNLIDNALKYGKKETVVEIIGKESNKEITISVIDYGIGIPQNQIYHLTERFYRVDKARSREMGGTGLGLAIVKHIINRHRGRLLITSKEGNGSNFSVTLPIWQGKIKAPI